MIKSSGKGHCKAAVFCASVQAYVAQKTGLSPEYWTNGACEVVFVQAQSLPDACRVYFHNERNVLGACYMDPAQSWTKVVGPQIRTNASTHKATTVYAVISLTRQSIQPIFIPPDNSPDEENLPRGSNFSVVEYVEAKDAVVQTNNQQKWTGWNNGTAAIVASPAPAPRPPRAQPPVPAQPEPPAKKAKRESMELEAKEEELVAARAKLELEERELERRKAAHTRIKVEVNVESKPSSPSLPSFEIPV